MRDPAAAQQLRVRATYASLAVAVVLIVAKFIAWVGTGSVALLSSLVDSLVDAAASTVNFFAIRHAATPADREHRFGHGKAEPLAAATRGVPTRGRWIGFGSRYPFLIL